MVVFCFVFKYVGIVLSPLSKLLKQFRYRVVRSEPLFLLPGIVTMDERQ